MRVERSHPARSSGSGVLVLEKALDVLECLADGRTWSVARLSTTTALNPASIYRLLATFESRAYVVRRPDRQGYFAGPALLSTSRRVLSHTSLTRGARPILVRLHDEMGETVNLGVLDRGLVRYVDIIESDHDLRMAAAVGSSGPVYCTSIGKAILSRLDPARVREMLAHQRWNKLTPTTYDSIAELFEDLEATRVRGFAVDDEETEVGARCVGVPIIDDEGCAIAGLSVSGPAWRMPPEKFARIGRVLQAAAKDIETSAGYAVAGREGSRVTSFGGARIEPVPRAADRSGGVRAGTVARGPEVRGGSSTRTRRSRGYPT
ncbi:MAG: IclR family transcriptional regulator [Candidatus Dormibacteraceae bacterium]